MKHPKLLLLTFSLLIILSGCNYYESEVPIASSAESSIDSSLLGKWILLSEKNEDQVGGYLQVMPFNNNEHLIQLLDYKDSTNLINSVENIRMFQSTVNERNYLNLQLIEENSRSNYLIFRYKPISKNRMKLFYLSKDKFQRQFDRSESFKEYIEENQKDFESYFQLEGILIRKVDIEKAAQ